MDGGGGGGDAFSSSTAPLTWHDFLERMRQPSAADFVKSIKSFIVSFSNKAPDPEKDSAAVQEFLANMEGSFRAHTLWAGSTEEELESAGEGLEKYVMTKLHNRAFASLPEDVKHDEELFEKIALVQKFIRPENLDIKPIFQNETSWLDDDQNFALLHIQSLKTGPNGYEYDNDDEHKLAQKELQKINMYKAPRDKLVCILNCCKVINNLLLNASIASSDDPPGADEFLPVLIYVTIKANPPQLYSNLQYIQRYRRQSRLVSEAAYFFTNILSAESFIWDIDARSLSMDEAEYQRNMESVRAQLLGLSNNSESQGNQASEEPVEHKIEATQAERDINYSVNKDHVGRDQQVANRPSVSDLEKHGATDLLKEDQLSRYFLDYPFLYAQAGDLTAEDVENLLNNYKQLVLKYVSLCRGMGVDSKITESTAESKISAEIMINSEKYDGSTNDKHEGSTNDRSEETFEGLTSIKSNEKYEGLKNNQSSDSLFSVLDDGESKLPADDSVSGSTVEKNEASE